MTSLKSPTRARFACASLLPVVLFTVSLGAQTPANPSENEGHAHLHFSHPMVTESPSPDTKLRFDFVHLRSSGAIPAQVNEYRAEYEYGFTDALSLAFVVPYVSISSPASARANGLGDIELQLKGASFAWDEHGMLAGGGVSAGLPTGSDEKGIGSGHIYEIAPFVDIALRRGELETVAFLSFSSTFNERKAESRERSARLDASALFRVHPQIEILGEISSTRELNAAGGANQETFLAPGLKWRPAKWTGLALGVSALFGVGKMRDTSALQFSAFYHF